MKISAERLALTQELQALVIDYWHDVDTNWGRNAPNYYTEDGVFEGTQNSLPGPGEDPRLLQVARGSRSAHGRPCGA